VTSPLGVKILMSATATPRGGFVLSEGKDKDKDKNTDKNKDKDKNRDE